MSVEAGLAACRFFHDAAALLLWGAFAYLATLVPGELASRLAPAFRAFRCWAVGVAVITTAAMLPMQTAAIGTGWPDAIDPATIRAVLSETNFGAAWIVQAALAMLLLAAVTPVSSQRFRTATTASMAGLLSASLALTGHAAMDEGGRGVLHHLNDAVHVLAGGAWLGALVPLLAVLRALDDPELRAAAATALRRFSRFGHGVVALVIATGIGNTALVLGRWPTDWSSPYQALLCAKLALVAVMAALALVNRYVLVPRAARTPVRSIRAIRRGTIFEVGLGLGAIACVSVFGLLEPA